MDYAKIEIDSSGTPMAVKYDDVYFSRNDGLAETNYVFIEGNNLKERLEKTADTFVVGETGFGSGMNMLALALYLKEHGLNNRIKFISTELHPIKEEDLKTILADIESVQPFIEGYLKAYPKLIQGEEVEVFPNFSVRILLGDVNQTLAKTNELYVDAWFLDGFSPAKNPEMWTEKLFNAMAKNTKAGGTFATFTAASFVRKGLENAGYAVNKKKGYGFKRHMLIGNL